MPVVSITRLRVRSWLYMPAFFLAAMKTTRQAKRSEGSVVVKVLQDRRNAFWTCTVWESEEAMRRFMLSAPHGPVMRKLMTWCDEAALVHWIQADAVAPSWAEAHRRLQQEGRRSKVAKPSPAQEAFSIAAPPANTKAEVRFK